MDIRNRFRRLNNMYRIQDDNFQEVTFRMKDAQKILYQRERESKEKLGHVRVVFLKSRQVGGTTYKVISMLDKCLFVPNTNARIVAHNMEKLQEIFLKVKFAYEKLPSHILLPDGKIWEKPLPKYDNKSEYYFEGINSHIKVTLDARSGTVSDLHISELAFINHAEEMMAGTMPATKNADITIETTANGMNYFYKFRNNHQNKSNPVFFPLFLPWYIEKSYTRPIDEYYTPPSDLVWMIDRYDLTPGQMYWYMTKIEELSDMRKVRQEYPSEPEEAFVSTGSSVFNILIIKQLPILTHRADTKYEHLRRYREPTGREMMGVDTAEGGEDGDYSSIKIRNIDDLTLVASYYERCTPGFLAEVIDHCYESGCFGRCGIERNNTGIGTITTIQERQYWWMEYLYVETTTDRKTNKKTKKIGRHTNGRTRPMMINDYLEHINNGYIIEVDERQKGEMYGFIYNESKKPEASKGGHDDAIISDSICLQMRKEP